MSGEALLTGNEPREWLVQDGQLIEQHPHGRCIYSRERLARELREHGAEIHRRQIEIAHLQAGLTAWSIGLQDGLIEEFRAEAADSRPGVVPVPGTVAEGLVWRE